MQITVCNAFSLSVTEMVNLNPMKKAGGASLGERGGTGPASVGDRLESASFVILFR